MPVKFLCALADLNLILTKQLRHNNNLAFLNLWRIIDYYCDVLARKSDGFGEVFWNINKSVDKKEQ